MSTDEITHEISEAGDTFTFRVESHEGFAFVVGFPPGLPDPNGFYLAVQDPAKARINPTLMRRLPYDRILRKAAQLRVAQLSKGEAERRPHGGDDDFRRQVAEVYAWATANNIPPRKAIAERWGKSEATAGRWIADARKAGVLAPYERGAGE